MNFKKGLQKAMLVGLITAGSLFHQGCGKDPNIPDKFLDISVERGYTRQQAKVALTRQLPKRYGKKVKNPETDEEELAPNYKHAPLEKLLEQVESEKRKLDQFLEYDIRRLNEDEMLDERGFRKKLEERKEKYDFRVRRLKRIILFKKFMREMRQNGTNLISINKLCKEYHAGLLFPGSKIEEMTKIEAGYVQNALQRDLIENYRISEEVLQQEPNPDFPHRDKIKKHIWKLKKVAYQLNGLDFDLDQAIDYIEIFRTKEDGATESKPAIVVYKSSDLLDLVVIDLDKEGELGHGEPDLIERIRGVKTGKKFCKRNKDYLKLIFKDRTNKKHKKPVLDEMTVEFVSINDLEDRLWEENMDKGFSVPFPYKNLLGTNFDLIPVFEKSESEEPYESYGKPKKLKEFKKKYLDPKKSGRDHPQRVVEFYRPNPSFAGEEFTSVYLINNMVRFTYETGEVRDFRIDAVIEEEPFKISFDFGKKFRDTIKDEDGNDQPKYEKRKRDVQPKDPYYSPDDHDFDDDDDF